MLVVVVGVLDTLAHLVVLVLLRGEGEHGAVVEHLLVL